MHRSVRTARHHQSEHRKANKARKRLPKLHPPPRRSTPGRKMRSRHSPLRRRRHGTRRQRPRPIIRIRYARYPVSRVAHPKYLAPNGVPAHPSHLRPLPQPPSLQLPHPRTVSWNIGQTDPCRAPSPWSWRAAPLILFFLADLSSVVAIQHT